MTGLRSIPPDFPEEGVAAVDARLAAIASEHHARIALAIESGSRAWGFPSPDSDFDCRFIFVRRLEDYLSPWRPRDVIETPLENDLDVNGWDLGKTLKLILKGNAVAVEWLQSPVVYCGDERFRDELLAFARRHADRFSIARHYLHLGERQRRTYFADDQSVPLKKIFYALRPAAALRWLRLHALDELPPMHFPTLIQAADVPHDVLQITFDLIRRKAVTRELGEGPVPAQLRAFIDAEFEGARDWLGERRAQRTAQERIDADALFLRYVGYRDNSAHREAAA